MAKILIGICHRLQRAKCSELGCAPIVSQMELEHVKTALCDSALSDQREPQSCHPKTFDRVTNGDDDE